MAIKLKWELGRQGTGYEKVTLLMTRFPIPMDAYLLRYTKDTGVPPHKDTLEQGRHYRLNIRTKAC